MTLSSIGRIKQALDLAKLAETGCTLTYFDVLELRGYIKDLEADVAERYAKPAEPAFPNRKQFEAYLLYLLEELKMWKRWHANRDEELKVANAEIESMHRELAAARQQAADKQAIIEEQEREIFAVHDEIQHHKGGAGRYAKYIERLAWERNEARAEVAKLREWGKKDKAIIALLEKERDEIKAGLTNPEAVHLNILRGMIALPEYYVRTTDTHGEWSKLERERDDARKCARKYYRAWKWLKDNNPSNGTPVWVASYINDLQHLGVIGAGTFVGARCARCGEPIAKLDGGDHVCKSVTFK